MTTQRIVTGHFERGDGTVWADSPMSFRLSKWSYLAGAIVPGGTIDDVTDSNGDSATPLWCNDEGWLPTVWTVTKPSGEQKSFTLPVGETPISLDELYALGGVTEWDEPTIIDWLETWSASIYAAFASAADPALGDGLVGTRNTGTGAVATTVHGKLGRWLLTSDYDTFEHAAAAADAAGLTLVVNTDETIQATLTTPATLAIAAMPEGRIEVPNGVTLTILGPFGAGRHHVFMCSGTGAVDLNNAGIDAVFPEWFGITKGADNTRALQLAATAHRVMLGDGTTQYQVQTDLNQWTDLNLHRIKHPGGDKNNGWKYGIWYGVRLQEGAEVRKCRILATRVSNPNGIMSGGVVVKTGKGTFVFAAGNPLYADPRATPADIDRRVGRVTITECEFRHFDFPTDPSGVVVPGGYQAGERYKCLVTQSCDEVIVTNNRIISHYDRDNYIGVMAFDTRNAVTFTGNYGEHVFCGVSMEYGASLDCSSNRWWNARQFCDLDARVNHAVVTNNRFDRDVRDRRTDDCVYEFNGTKNLTMTGNVTIRGNRGVVLSIKSHLYQEWEDVMRQTDYGPTPPLDKVNACMWENCSFIGNEWRDINWQAFLVGSNWNNFPHQGQPVGDDLVILDTMVDCGWELGSGDDHAIVQVYEGRGVDLRPRVSNWAQILTRITQPASAGATQITLADASRFKAGDLISVQYDTIADKRKYELFEIVSVAGNVVTLPTGLSSTLTPATRFNTARGGSGGGFGGFYRAFVEDDGVNAKVSALSVAALTDDVQITVANANGFTKYATVSVTMDDPDLDVFSVQMLDVNTTTNVITLAEGLPGTAAVGNRVEQMAAVGAGTDSGLSGTIGGSYQNCGFSGIKLFKPSRIYVDRPVIRNCGRHAQSSARASMWIQGIEQEYTRPGHPVANLIMDGANIETTIDDIRYGLMIQAGDLGAPGFESGWTPGYWSMLLTNSRIQGHNYRSSPGTDAFDLYLDDTGVTSGGSNTSTEALDNLAMNRNNLIGSTSFNNQSSSPISFTTAIQAASKSYPLGSAAGMTSNPVGMTIWNTQPTPGGPIGWVCVQAGLPGVWATFGEIGNVQVKATEHWTGTPALAPAAQGQHNVGIVGASEGAPLAFGIKGLPAGDWEVSARCTSSTNVSFLFRNRTAGTMPAGTPLDFYAIVLPYTP